MKKISIITLGCKTNQYESQALGEQLEKENFLVTHHLEKADIFILNTCAVTNEAERKSRQHISKFIKLNPKCQIFVCGCASQNNAEQFRKLPNVEYVIGNLAHNSIFEKIVHGKNLEPVLSSDTYEEISITKTPNARAYLKIQDGCNRFCSYCIIPHLRGRSRSRDITSILEEFKTLKNAGAKEIVLTGVDISDYRIDDKPALLEVLKQINEENVRFRLGSIEPNLLTEDFVATLATLKNFCPHFHISMQSGSSSVLKRMNRHYTAKFFIERTKIIRHYFENPAITTDLILGFPGETDQEFAETLDTLNQVRFAQMHIFPYSRRQGTTADKLLNLETNPEFQTVDARVVKERMKIALDLAKKLEHEYLAQQKGRILEAVIEENKNGVWVGTTANYMRVFIDSACPNLQNTIQKIRALEVCEGGLKAEIVE